MIRPLLQLSVTIKELHVHHVSPPDSPAGEDAIMGAIKEGMDLMNAALETALADLKREAAENTSLKDSILAVLSGVPAMIETAVTTALAASDADAESVAAAVREVVTSIDSDQQELAAAITTGTPVDPGADTQAG